MRYYLHYNIIYCILVARNCYHEASKKITAGREKTSQSIPKIRPTLLLQTCNLPRNPALW